MYIYICIHYDEKLRREMQKALSSASAFRAAGAIAGALADTELKESQEAASFANEDKRKAAKEQERAEDLSWKSMDAQERAKMDKEQADKLLHQALSSQRKATVFFAVACFSSVLLLLSSSPVGFSLRDLSQASRGLQETFLGAMQLKDPRKNGKWKWHMWVLEWLAFATSSWIAAIIFCNQVPLKASQEDISKGPVHVWNTFCWLLVCLALVGLLQGAFMWIWTMAELEPARICAQNCLTYAEKRALLFETVSCESSVAAQRGAAYGVLCMFTYVALRDSHPCIIHHMLNTLNLSPALLLWTLVSIASLRACCGFLRCSCACHVQTDTRNPGCLERMWHENASCSRLLMFVIVLAVCYKQFHHFWKAFRSMPDLLTSKGILHNVSALVVLALTVDLIAFAWLLFRGPFRSTIHAFTH